MNLEHKLEMDYPALFAALKGCEDALYELDKLLESVEEEYEEIGYDRGYADGAAVG